MSLLSAMGGFLFGYDTGIVSGAMVFVRKVFNLNSLWQELVVSITILGAWILSLMAGSLSERYGRKSVILYASIVFTIGSLIMGAAWSKWVLLFGRATVGVAVGMASTVVPMYIAELAPSNIRGSLVTMNNLFITIGQMSAAITAGAFSYDHENGWRWMLALAAFPAVIQFVGFMFMPESPRWLIRHQRENEALVALKQIRGNAGAAVLREFEKIRQNQLELVIQEDRRKEQKRNIIVAIFRKTATRRALIVGCLLMATQQLAGINTVMYYTATIIEMSGVQSQSAAVWLAVPTATVYVIFSLCGYLLADRVGRRSLTLGSLLGVILSLLLLGTGFHLTSMNGAEVTALNMSTLEACYSKRDCSSCIADPRCGFCYDSQSLNTATCLQKNPMDPSHSLGGNCAAIPEVISALTPPDRPPGSPKISTAPLQSSQFVFANHICPSMNHGIGLNTWLVLIGLVTYLSSFAPGMAPMPWTINSEIYPMWARSFCYSIATSINWMFNLLISLTFISLTELITTHGAFYLYAVISSICWLLLFWKLPETRGRSLEDISSLFAKTKQPDDEEIIDDGASTTNQSSGMGATIGQKQGQLAFNQLAAAATINQASGKQLQHQWPHQFSHPTINPPLKPGNTQSQQQPQQQQQQQQQHQQHLQQQQNNSLRARHGPISPPVGHDNFAFAIDHQQQQKINTYMGLKNVAPLPPVDFEPMEDQLVGFPERSKSFKLDNPFARPPVTAISQPDLKSQAHYHHQDHQRHQDSDDPSSQ